MADPHTEGQAAADAIANLDDTSPDGLYRGTQGFSDRALAVGLTSLGGGGGGGGSLPIQTGDGSPVESVTPTAAGYVYLDTTNGTIWQASGPTNLDWIGVGNVPGNIGEATGLFVSNGRVVYLLAGDRDASTTTVYVGSTFAQWNGHGQGLILAYGETEGSEQFTVRAGSTGQYIATLLDGLGQTVLPGHVICQGPLVVALTDGAGIAITAGQAAFWYDDDDDVPAIRITAKTADGTTVTGEILLT